MYTLTQFGGVALPLFNVTTELTGGEVKSTLTQTVNGWYDLRGSKRAFPRPASYRMRGVYAPASSLTRRNYWARGGGDRIVASAGNPVLLVATGPGEVREDIDALRALIGSVATLYRVPNAGYPAVSQFTQARLLSVRYQLGPQPTGVDAVEVEALFESLSPYWQGAARSVSGLYLAAFVNGNAPVRNAVLTITGTTSATSVSGAGSSFGYVGAGQTLVINGNTATADGLPTSVTITAEHSIDTLIELAPGANNIIVYGASGATLTWREAWQ